MRSVSAARIEPFRGAGVLIGIEPTTNAGTCKRVGQTVVSSFSANHVDGQTLLRSPEVFGESDGADGIVRCQVGSRPEARRDASGHGDREHGATTLVRGEVHAAEFGMGVHGRTPDI